ncbi:DUF4233 domain-containing protein [Streptomyces sp. NPDC058417]|uniref:DUF4233 domain-containing protein n=1 Tax=unclassified Streptomyces TaxID=2593676 RepID=UPI003645FCF8
MRTLCSSTLIGEFFIIGFAGLVAMKDPDLAQSTVWTVCGIAMFFSIALCAMVTRPGGVALGWALQVALVAAGFVVPTMFVLGILFGALWWASVHYGRVIDEAKARFAAQNAQHAEDGPATPGTPPTPGSADTADAV